jgi:hypothetical protein
MKTKKIVTGAAVALLFLSGCSTVESGLLKKERVKVAEASTNRVMVATESVGIAVAEAQAIGAQVLATNILGTNSQLVTVMPERYETRYIARPAAQSAIRTGGDLLPIPGGGIIGMALSGLLSLIAGWKTASARGEKIAGKMAVSMDEYRNTVKAELERFNRNESKELDPAGFDAKAMKALKISQRAAGYGEQIAKVVHKFTGHTSNS